MATKMGNVPMLDSNNVMQQFIYTPKVVTKTAAYTCKAYESGTIFVTTGNTAALTFTLPPISDGPWIFWFVNGADQNMIVASETADTLVTFNDLAADSVAYQTSSEKIGGLIIAFSDGTSAIGLTPIIQEAQTVTVATA
jgi:hypothetical protein